MPNIIVRAGYIFSNILDKNFLNRLGFPGTTSIKRAEFSDLEKAYKGPTQFRLHDDQLSNEASEALGKIWEEDVLTFAKAFFGVFYRNVPMLFWVSLFVGFTVCWASWLTFGNTVLLFISGLLLWGCFASYRQHLVLRYTEDNIRAKVAAVLNKNQADLDLTAGGRELIEGKWEALALGRFDIAQNYHIDAETGMSWRPHQVTFRRGEGDLESGAIVVFTSNGSDSLVCNLPTLLDAQKWLDRQLAELSERARPGTHMHAYLTSLKAETIVNSWWKPHGMMQSLGNLDVKSTHDLLDRPAVEVFGQRQDDGQVLVHALSFPGEGQVHAPGAPVMYLRDQMMAHLCSQPEHPALIAQSA